GLYVVDVVILFLFFFQAEDGIRDFHVTGVQTCALPILNLPVLTSMTVIASVRSITRVPPEGNHTLRSSALASCSSIRYFSKTSSPVFSCRSTRASRSGATVRM